MKRKSLFRGLLLSGALLFVLQGRAQDTFAYRAPLDTIGQAGFYRVILTPEVLAKCKEDLSDLRINAVNGSYVPYVMKSDFPIYNGESFIEFPILPAKKEDSAGDVRIGNWSGGAIQSLLLYMHTSDVWRDWTFSGSNDGEKWYVIKEHIRMGPSVMDNTDRMAVTLDLPRSNYHYFKIIQEDKGVLPLNIYRAGVITKQQAGTKRYRPTPQPVISQKDSSNHHSYVTLTFQEPYLIENLYFDIKSPRLYKRETKVLIKEDPYRDERLILDPASHSFDVLPLKVRSITLEIDNEDNAPLVFNKIETNQKERYLLTWLEPGRYELLAGDKKAQTPKYDLGNFVDTVSREPAAILPGALIPTNIHPAPPVVKPPDNNGIYLWGAIVAVLAMLIWLCFNMLKSIRETRQKEEMK